MKICPTCNTQNTDQITYCLNCGQSLANVGISMISSDPVQEKTPHLTTQPMKGTGINHLKKYVKIIIAAIVVLVVGIVAFILLKPAKYELLKNGVSTFSLDDKLYVVFDNKKPISIDKDDIQYNRTNSTQTAFAYLSKDESLFCLQNSDNVPKKIADDVRGFDFTIDGKSIAYSSNDNDYYTCELGKSPKKVITFDDDVSNFVVSFDGNTLAYSIDESFYISDGKPVSIEIGKDSSLEFISNDGKYLYFTRNDILYVLKNKKDTNRIGEFTSIVDVNRAGNEILYRTKDGLNISIDGNPGERIIRLDSGITKRISPENSIGWPKTLIGEVFETNKGLYKIGKTQDSTIKLTSEVLGAVMAQNGKSLGYLRSSKSSMNIFRISDFSKAPDSLEPLNGDISIKSATGLDFSPDLGKIFFLDENKDLYYIKGNNAPKRVTDDVDNIYTSFDNNICFVIKDKELLFTDGSKIERVTNVKGYVESFRVKATHIICETDEAFYRCTSGSKFEQLFSK